MIKKLQALCATSSFTKRLEIHFDDEVGLITRVTDPVTNIKELDYFFDDDSLLFSGMGDIHIHAREDISGKNNYKEDFSSCKCASLNGGVVHVGDMPNNPIPPIDDKTYKEKLQLSLKHEFPFLMYAGIGPKTRPLNFKVPYKVYMGPSIGELYFKNNQDLDEVLKYYQGQFVSFHCEDPIELENNKTGSSHFEKRPIKAEIMATEFAIALIEKYKLKGKLCHYSAGDGLERIKKAKSLGLDVTCEVTPQHLYFNEEMILDKTKEEQTLFQMNPPIRSSYNQKILIEALRSGDIDYLATDHAPHSKEEKEKGMSGMPGLDTYAGFVTWLILDQKVDYQTIAKVCSEKPGEFFNQFMDSINLHVDAYQKYGAGFGKLEVGYSASFTVLDLKRPMTVDSEFLKTKAHWSPFFNVTFPGSLKALIFQGRLI